MILKKKKVVWCLFFFFFLNKSLYALFFLNFLPLQKKYVDPMLKVNSPSLKKNVSIVSGRLAEGIVLHVVGCVAVEACTRREADVFDVRLTASSLFISFYQWE